MDQLRKMHNKYKAQLIQKYVRRGQHVLDCGCGRGGDWVKWKVVGARVTAVDPDAESIKEAIRRASIHAVPGICIQQGDVRDVTGQFDAVCYNFSIHYIRPTLDESARAIARRTRLGGVLFGIVPDAERIRAFSSPDPLGNTVQVVSDTTVAVKLVDGPFYSGATREEPLINRATLECALDRWFTLEVWEPMCPEPTGFVSDIYSVFVFRRKNVPP